MNEPIQMLFPIAGLYLLVVIVAAKMAMVRKQAVKSGTVPVNYFKVYSADIKIPEEVEIPARNYTNLFELPVLFYVVCILFFITNTSDAWSVGLAWIFVLSRYVHSYVHISGNKVMVRMRVFMLGMLTVLVLFSLWTYRALI